ncbi:MAG TPA: hypothetical protein VG965_06290 [Patescibacteria group bacterium]|nr:hypothetical protein [Patescibacteria group bacterium]
MQDDQNSSLMTDQDIKDYNRSAFLSRIKYYFEKIEPTIVKIFNMVFYYTLRFVKSFISAIFKMAMGKDI